MRKTFPGVVALDNVDFDVQRGEVHALLGANGAGKSTLIKIVAGLYRADAGEIRIDGRRVALRDTHAARDLGVSVIYQDHALVPSLSVAENLFLGREPLTRLGLIDRRRTRAQARRLLEGVGAGFSTDVTVSSLSVGQRQLVEIAKALGIDAKLLILDEPTASLSAGEAERLFALVRRLAQSGVGIVYVSHRLEEIAPLVDRVTVLRDGRSVGTYPADQLDRRKVVALITGREGARAQPPGNRGVAIGEPLLELRHLGRENEFDDITLTLRRGEILVLTGLVGAGRTELLETVFGARAAGTGEVRVGGRSMTFASPRDAIRGGIALIPEDRRGQGLAEVMPVFQNITLASLASFVVRCMLSLPRELQHARRMIEDLAIRTPNPFQPTWSLSGGNQQKVVLAKWLSTSADVFLLDEPTQGVDVGAKEEIYRIIRDVAASGKGVLVVSSDLEEVLQIADRVLAIRQGRIVEEFTGHLEPRRVIDAITHGRAA
ncbi:MAG: sugar ABC transporter ATP-binding protein [Xanthobacteraceae bacterium]